MRVQTLLAFSVLLTGTGLWAQSHPGVPYGTRDPAVCPSTKEPAKGALSNDQARAYIHCGFNGEREGNDTIYLLSSLKIEVAPSSRPFNQWTDAAPDIDPKQPVYTIRGSYIAYICYIPGQGGAFGQAMGKNCIRMDAGDAPLHAAGFCYRDSFNDWHCRKQPTDVVKQTAAQPAPGR